MDIINIIDRLEALITTSTKVPATQRTLLDVNKVQELMDQLRLAVPQDVRAAKEILVNKDDILNLAEAERRRTKAQAEEEFQNRINQSEVLKEAQRRARQIVDDAERKSNQDGLPGRDRVEDQQGRGGRLRRQGPSQPGAPADGQPDQRPQRACSSDGRRDLRSSGRKRQQARKLTPGLFLINSIGPRHRDRWGFSFSPPLILSPPKDPTPAKAGATHHRKSPISVNRLLALRLSPSLCLCRTNCCTARIWRGLPASSRVGARRTRLYLPTVSSRPPGPASRLRRWRFSP